MATFAPALLGEIIAKKSKKKGKKMENFSNYLEWLSGLVLFVYAFLAHYRINKLEKIIKELK